MSDPSPQGSPWPRDFSVVVGGLHRRKEVSVEIQEEKKDHTKILSPVPKMNLFPSHPLGITTQQRVVTLQVELVAVARRLLMEFWELPSSAFRGPRLSEREALEKACKGAWLFFLQHRALPPTASGSLCCVSVLSGSHLSSWSGGDGRMTIFFFLLSLLKFLGLLLFNGL